MAWLRKNLSGILMSFALALASTWLGNRYPIIGGPVFGIVIGILLNNTIGKPVWAEDGVKFTSKKILQWAIIVLGSGLSLTQVWKTGLQSLSVMLLTL
ncbi:MAG: putative sulfate exporter family transporter, partial [Bacillota bacterium]|nr:putative sulfate exporter family transporter [Bacillota bacterium]